MPGFKIADAYVEVTADTSRVGKDIDAAGGEVEGKGHGLGGKLVGGLVAGIVAAGVGKALTGGLNLASNLEQSIGGVESVFKSSSGQMVAWSNQAATSVGLTKDQYNTFATTLGASLKNAGVPMDELGGKTNDLVTKGADLAATFGGSTTDAVEALGAGLRGEFDSLDKYGISVKASDIATRLAAQGQDKLTGEALRNAQATAYLAIIQEQTTDATGAFARESDTLAGGLSISKAGLLNLGTTMGGVLLPAVSALVAKFNTDAMPAIQAFTDVIAGKAGPIIEKFSTWITNLDFGAIGTSLGPVMDALAPLGEAFMGLFDAVTQAGIPMGPLGLAFDVLKPILPLVAGLLTTVVTVLTSALAPILPVVGSLISTLAGVLSGVLAAILPTIVTLITQLAGIFPMLTPLIIALVPVVLEVATVFASLLTSIIPLLPALMSIVTAALPPLVALITALAPYLPTIAVGVLAIVAGMKAWAIIQTVMRAAIVAATVAQLAYNIALAANPIGIIILAVVGLVAALVYFFTQTEIGKQAWATFMEAMRIGWEAIKSFFVAGWALIQTVLAAIGSFISSTWASIQAVWDTVMGAISAAISWYFNLYLTIITTVFNAIKSFIETVWNGIKSFFTALWDGIVAVVTAYINAYKAIIMTVFNAVKSFIESVWNGIKSFISGAVGAIQGAIHGLSDIPGKIGGWFGAAKDAVVNKFNEVVSFVGGIPGRITGALGNLGSLLSNAGHQVIQGFLDGINSAFNKVKSTLSNLTSLLPSWKGPLPTDKTILRGAGQAVIGGFVEGLESQYGAVKDSLGGLTQMVETAGKALVTFEDGSSRMFTQAEWDKWNGHAMPALNVGPSTFTAIPRAQTSSTRSQTGGTSIHIENITIDAKSVQEMRDVTDFFNKIAQTARQGRGLSVSRV